MDDQNNNNRGMSGIYLLGSRIYLREVQLSDVTDAYCRWMNDPEVNRFLETRFSRHSKKDIKSYVRRMAADPDIVFLAIVVNETHRHIGNIKIGPVNRCHLFADMSLIIGEKSSWRKGYGSEAISLAADYAFNLMKLHKLTAGFYADNIASITAFKKNGFVEEGFRKNHRFFKGVYVDEVLMGRVR